MNSEDDNAVYRTILSDCRKMAKQKTAIGNRMVFPLMG
jgi:hypothetical protein